MPATFAYAAADIGTVGVSTCAATRRTQQTRRHPGRAQPDEQAGHNRQPDGFFEQHPYCLNQVYFDHGGGRIDYRKNAKPAIFSLENAARGAIGTQSNDRVRSLLYTDVAATRPYAAKRRGRCRRAANADKPASSRITLAGSGIVIM